MDETLFLTLCNWPCLGEARAQPISPAPWPGRPRDQGPGTRPGSSQARGAARDGILMPVPDIQGASPTACAPHADAHIQQVRLRRNRLMAVSFAQDIRPLFAEMDIAHMRNLGVQPDNFDDMRNSSCLQNVLNNVSTRTMTASRNSAPSWSPESVQLFRYWIAAGYQASGSSCPVTDRCPWGRQWVSAGHCVSIVGFSVGR